MSFTVVFPIIRARRFVGTREFVAVDVAELQERDTFGVLAQIIWKRLARADSPTPLNLRIYAACFVARCSVVALICPMHSFPMVYYPPTSTTCLSSTKEMP